MVMMTIMRVGGGRTGGGEDDGRGVVKEGRTGQVIRRESNTEEDNRRDEAKKEGKQDECVIIVYGDGEAGKVVHSALNYRWRGQVR